MIPFKIKEVIDLFYKNNLEFCLFKCEHVFNGQNKNLDILFRTNTDYNIASRLLKENEFELYLSEKVEKYKRMYVKFSVNEYTRIHLHREIAWHGLKIIPKKDIFLRIKNNLPSSEDQLLIHFAHCIFENFYFKDYQLKLIKDLLKKNLDWLYIKKKLKVYGWRKEFFYILSCIKKNKQPSKKILMKQFVKKALTSPHSYFFLLNKLFSIIIRNLNFRRKGCLITLIGVNGSGKTTLVDETIKIFSPLTNSINGSFGYYFGYVPFTPWAKYLNQRNKLKKKELFKELIRDNKDKKNKKISYKEELFFMFNFIEYLFRYFFILYPKLVKNKLVITDRYFYDLYGQYTNSNKSKVLPILIKIFPRPNFVFILDSPINTIINRDKNINVKNKSVKKSSTRKIHSVKYLEDQLKRYNFLTDKINGVRLNTTKNLYDNVNTIIEQSWKKLLR